jgi:hypothetical protein
MSFTFMQKEIGGAAEGEVSTRTFFTGVSEILEASMGPSWQAGWVSNDLEALDGHLPAGKYFSTVPAGWMGSYSSVAS